MSITLKHLDMLRGVHWFTGTYSTVGIVLVKGQGIDGHRAYIGGLPNLPLARAMEVGAIGEEAEALHLAQFGCRITDRELLRVFFPHVTDWSTQ